MTDTTEQEALAQAVAAAGRRMQDYNIMSEENALRQSIDAHARAIERHKTDIADLQAEYEEVCKLHEAFRQEVSFALIEEFGESYSMVPKDLHRFIIAKPDPLVEALDDMKDGRAGPTTESYADQFRAAIEKRGGKIVWGDSHD